MYLLIGNNDTLENTDNDQRLRVIKRKQRIEFTQNEISHVD